MSWQKSTVGLDQLGPRHATSSCNLPPMRRRNPLTISQRLSSASTKANKKPISLPNISMSKSTNKNVTKIQTNNISNAISDIDKAIKQATSSGIDAGTLARNLHVRGIEVEKNVKSIRNKQTQIYCISESDYNDKGPCKIGIAVNAKERLGSLQGGNWRPLYILWTIDAPNRDIAFKVEQSTLMHFRPNVYDTTEKGCSLKSEWIAASAHEIHDYVCKQLELYQDHPQQAAWKYRKQKENKQKPKISEAAA